MQAGLIFNLSVIPPAIGSISSISAKRASQETTTPLPINELAFLWQIEEGNKCNTIFFPLTIRVWPAL